MRVLALLAFLLPLGLVGCSGLPGEAPEGCGEERTHHLQHDGYRPIEHAEKRTQGESIVYLWEIKVTGACKAEHVAIDMSVTLEPDEDCDNPTRVVGSAYLPGSFISARIINMGDPNVNAETTLRGETSYGLKQASGGEDEPASYTTDLEVHFDAFEFDEQCAANVVKEVEIKATDRVAE